MSSEAERAARVRSIFTPTHRTPSVSSSRAAAASERSPLINSSSSSISSNADASAAETGAIDSDYNNGKSHNKNSGGGNHFWRNLLKVTLLLLILVGVGLAAGYSIASFKKINAAESPSTDVTAIRPKPSPPAAPTAFDSPKTLASIEALQRALSAQLAQISNALSSVGGQLNTIDDGITTLSVTTTTTTPPPPSTPSPTPAPVPSGPVLCNLTAASIIAQCPSVLGTCVDFDNWWTAACPYAALSKRAPTFAIDAPSQAYSYLASHCPGVGAPITDVSELQQYVRELSVFNSTAISSHTAFDWIASGDVTPTSAQLRTHLGFDPAGFGGQIYVDVAVSCNGAPAVTTPIVCTVSQTKRAATPPAAVNTCDSYNPQINVEVGCTTSADCESRFVASAGFGIGPYNTTCAAGRCVPFPFTANTFAYDAALVGRRCFVNNGDLAASFGIPVADSASCTLGRLRNCTDPVACGALTGLLFCTALDPTSISFDCSCAGTTGLCADPRPSQPATPSTSFYCSTDDQCATHYPHSSALCLAGRCQAVSVFGNAAPAAVGSPCLADISLLQLGLQDNTLCASTPDGKCENWCYEGVGVNNPPFGVQCLQSGAFFPCNCDAAYTTAVPYSKTCATDAPPCSSYRLCEAVVPLVPSASGAEQQCVYQFSATGAPQFFSDAGAFTAPPAASSAALRQLSFVYSGDASVQYIAALPDTDGLTHGTDVVKRLRQYSQEASRRRSSFVGTYGDTVYQDVFSQKAALIEAEFFKTYADQYTDSEFRALLRDNAISATWDDHEVVNDWTAQGQLALGAAGVALVERGRRAFLASTPNTAGDPLPPAPGTPSTCIGAPQFRVRDYGANVRFIHLDTHSCSNTSASLEAACAIVWPAACVNFSLPALVDTAATLSDAARTAYYNATGLPVACLPPVTSACTAAHADSTRTALGLAQRQALLAALASAGNRVVFIVSSPAFSEQQHFALTTWAGFGYERHLILAQIATNANRNVIFLSTDSHVSMSSDLFVNTHRSRTVGEQPVAVEFSSSPIAAIAQGAILELEGLTTSVIDALFAVQRSYGLFALGTERGQHFASVEVDVDRCTVVLTSRDYNGSLTRDSVNASRVVERVVPLRSLGGCSATPLPVCVWPQTTGCTPCRTSAACPSGGPRTFTYCSGGTVCKSVANCEPPLTTPPTTFVVDDLLNRSRIGYWHSAGQASGALCKPCTTDTPCDDGRPETVDFCNFDLPSPGQSANGRCDARRCGECFYDSDCNPPDVVVVQPASTRRCAANFTCIVVDGCVARNGVNPVLVRPVSQRSQESDDAHYGSGNNGAGGGYDRGYGYGSGHQQYGGHTRRDTGFSIAKTWGNEGNNDNGYYGHDTQGKGQPTTVPCTLDADCPAPVDPTDQVWCNNLHQCVRQDCACSGERYCERTLNPTGAHGVLVSCDLPAAGSTNGTCTATPCASCRSYTCPAAQPQPETCSPLVLPLVTCSATAGFDECAARFPGSGSVCVEGTCTVARSVLQFNPSGLAVGDLCISDFSAFRGPGQCGVATVSDAVIIGFPPGVATVCLTFLPDFSYSVALFSCPCVAPPTADHSRRRDAASNVAYLHSVAGKATYAWSATASSGVSLPYRTFGYTPSVLPKPIAPRNITLRAMPSPSSPLLSAEEATVDSAPHSTKKRGISACPAHVCADIGCRTDAECYAKTGFAGGPVLPSCNVAKGRCELTDIFATGYVDGQRCFTSNGATCSTNTAQFCPASMCGGTAFDNVCTIDAVFGTGTDPYPSWPCDCTCASSVCTVNADCDDRSNRTTDVCRQDVGECVNVACATCNGPPPKYAATGPYAVGFRSYRMPNLHPHDDAWPLYTPPNSPYAGNLTTINVYYPTDSTAGLHNVTGAYAFDLKQFLHPNILAALTLNATGQQPTMWASDLWWNATLAASPVSGQFGARWPVTMFAHGFNALPTFTTDTQRYLASWGFVVVEPHYMARSTYTLGAPWYALDDFDPNGSPSTTMYDAYDTQLARQFITAAALTSTSLTGAVFNGRLDVTSHGPSMSAVVAVGKSIGATDALNGLASLDALSYILDVPSDVVVEHFATQVYGEPLLETPYGGLIIAASADHVVGLGPQHVFDTALGEARMLTVRGFGHSVGEYCITLPDLPPRDTAIYNLFYAFADNHVVPSIATVQLILQQSDCFAADSSYNALPIVGHARVAHLRRVHGLDYNDVQLRDATLCYFNRTAYVDQQQKCSVGPQCSVSVCGQFTSQAVCDIVEQSSVLFNSSFDVRIGRCQTPPFSNFVANRTLSHNVSDSTLGQPCLYIQSGIPKFFEPGNFPADSCVASTVGQIPVTGPTDLWNGCGFGTASEAFPCACKCYENVVAPPGVCKQGCHNACGVCSSASADPVCASQVPQAVAYWKAHLAEWSYETRTQVLCSTTSSYARTLEQLALMAVTSTTERWYTLAQQYVAAEQNAQHHTASFTAYPRCLAALQRAQYQLEANCGVSPGTRPITSSLSVRYILFGDLTSNLAACNAGKECATAAQCNDYAAGPRTCSSTTGRCSA